MNRIYKICSRDEWSEAEAAGLFVGSALDRADGFIHFSTRAQVEETARRHFAARTDLVLVELDADELGLLLRWEPSRGGNLFPHLYAPLQTSSAKTVVPLPLGATGEHVFPWSDRP